MARAMSEVLKKAIQNIHTLTNSSNIILNIAEITKRTLENINKQEKILSIVPDYGYLQMFSNIQMQIDSLVSNEANIRFFDQTNYPSKKETTYKEKE